ncbi:preprotein translocase subunit YajC [Heyndrickxia sporothermodurans]|uniref:Preprotein translocase subunit YajC n=1 Tax=Heyndrickxia sporothermodurans TaxID=46224 RepID=A0AB37HGR1_9BACI|nr:preprotein translocase subunit YajC [Heyndrickxia sporothermodurans]MBL5766133.1 preprotein translocase subunit YajC [Heyndrickxia sporothermodurans]MBL5769574.1 preprotein translocase subunit YajC [Heyndrickxia sporothermodurans]MBL5773357.1 preprotein translocase subunit YajC [Heyndrickxia sporothermodurans]MBL5776738.1 preprotein translocase subunit YajC [Heyndrickxia sporothermodurans]MBL5780248.1 preprotein translocase subunit YajC [Heyndrickxia sporothermodurans]
MQSLGGLLPILLMFVLFYFLLIRPNQKRQKNVQMMQNNLSKGDKIVTIGGLHGIVDAIDERQIVIKCGDGSRLTYDRSAIREVVESAATAQTAE